MGHAVSGTWQIPRHTPRWDTTEVQHLGGQRRSVPHGCRGASAGVSLERILAKAVGRQGTSNVLIGKPQFSLDIIVQCIY
jgi:hypothetical protein